MVAHVFTFTVTATVERESGKFVSRDEIQEQLQEALDGANPDSLSGLGADGDSEYVVSDWSVE